MYIYTYSSLLQCVAICCSVLECAGGCCSVLQCAAVCYSVLQCDVCCRVLQCVAVCCSVLQCVVCCSVLQCVMRLKSVRSQCPRGVESLHCLFFFAKRTVQKLTAMITVSK